MEARRNLEAVYKRRLEEIENKRFEAELHLQVLKQYLTICNLDAQPVSTSSIDTIIEEFMSTLKEKLHSLNTASGMNAEDIWNDSMHIAKSQLDKLDFAPKSVWMGVIKNTIMTQLHLQSQDIVTSLADNVCFSVDLDHLNKICNGLACVFGKLGMNVRVAMTYESTAGWLQVQLSEVNNRFYLLKDAYGTADAIFNHTAPSSTRIDDTISVFFICKSLSQSMGGDLVLQSDSVLSFNVPGEIVADEQCRVPWSAQPTIPAPAPVVPIPAPVPAPVPTPAPVFTPVPAPTPIAAPPPPPSPPSPPSEPVSTPSPSQPQKTLKGKTLNILMAEDDPTSRRIFKRYWNLEGHNVFLAADGIEALEMFKKQKFSIVFLDVEMPFKNGIETVKDMRAWERDNNKEPTPIIGVSGYTEKQYREQALSSGMNEFISKGQGYQFKDIYRIVVEYCG